jgi:uncharacterized protein YndB with AHSA1/START domain
MSDAMLAARPSLTLQRRLGAPPARVFSAWTDPREVIRWFGRPGGSELEAEIDARAGGRYRIVYRSKEGERHEVGGTYLEFVPAAKLVFTWTWHSTPERESLVTVELERDGGEGTLLTLIHERFFDEAARERHLSGWIGGLDKLAALFT